MVISERSSSQTKLTLRSRRNADATRARILMAAKKEFARSGFDGARVDMIALEAKANKRMIYHYFESKDGLFQTVLECAYADIRHAERELHLDDIEPKQALEAFVRFTWNYYIENPEFISLVNSENLYQGCHLKNHDFARTIGIQVTSTLKSILDRGKNKGIFRPDVDEFQLNITIAAISYYYFTNCYTGSILYGRDFLSPENLSARINFNIETVLKIVSSSD